MLMTTVSSRDTSAIPPLLMEPGPAAGVPAATRSPLGRSGLPNPDRLLDSAAASTAASREEAERDLVARLQRGEDASFDVLVRQYGGHMLAVARRLLRNEDDAQEAVQDAFMQAIRALPHFRAESRLSTWLHRIAVNAALMRLRRARRRPEVVVDDLLPHFDEDGHHAESIQSLPVSVETALDSAHTRAQVRACIAQLPDQHRAVIVLRDIEELSTAEAAQALGISENAVKIRLHRAHQALRTLLVRELGDRPM